MFKNIVHNFQSLWWVFILFTVALVIGLSLYAQRVAAAGASHYSILAETIQPLDSTIGFNNTSAYLVTTAGSTVNAGTQYVAQVNLPDGAVISDVRVYGIDSDTVKNIGAGMYRYNQDNTPVYSSVTNFVPSSGNPGKTVLNLPMTSVAAATIDNLTYSYSVFIDLPRATELNTTTPNLGILRIIIDWSYPTYVPLISR